MRLIVVALSAFCCCAFGLRADAQPAGPAPVAGTVIVTLGTAGGRDRARFARKARTCCW